MAPTQTLKILDSIYQNYFSVCSIVPLVFTLSLAIILLNIPEKSKAAVHLGLTYLLLSIFYSGYAMAAMLYHPVAAYHRWITAGIVTFAEIHFILFLFNYPESQKSKFVQILSVILYAISIAATAYFIFATIDANRIYHFDGHYWDFDADTPSMVLAIIIIAYLMLLLAVGIGKVVIMKSKIRWSILAATIIIFIIVIIPATINLLSRKGLLDRGTYQVAQDLLVIIGFFLVFVIYSNTTEDKTSIMGKSMGIILAFCLLIFQGLSYFTLKDYDSTYDEHRHHILSLAVQAKAISPEISYLIGYDCGAGLPVAIKGPEDSSRAVNLHSTRCELFNTAQYERIAQLKDLPPPIFRERLKEILNTEDICFRGYRNAIESRLAGLPAARNSTQQILSHLMSIQRSVSYTCVNISRLPDNNFAGHLKKYLESVAPGMVPFKTAITAILGSSRASGAELKQEVMQALSPMNPSSARRYRTSADSMHHYTAFMLYDHDRHTIYEAGFDYRAYREYSHPMAMKFIMMLGIMLVFIFIGYRFFFLGYFVHPMERILDAINSVRKGNIDIVIPITANDELGFISHNFNEMASDLRLSKDVMSEYAENLEKMVQERTSELEQARDALWSEMELARKMQTILIPEHPLVAGYEITGYMLPATMVGGDYYDIINTDGFDWIVIGDVSGHGITAGIIMMMAQTAIHTVLAGKPDIRPSDLINQINRVITDNIRKLNEEKFMTITVMACMKSGDFYVSGLHQDILVYRARRDTIEILKSSGIILGLRDMFDYPSDETKLRLEQGDIMLLYTDGITESWRKGSIRNQRNPDSDMFGLDRLREVFLNNHALGTDGIRDAVLNALEGYHLSDDVSMVIIKKI